MDLYLVDPLDFALHRILDRDDLHVLPVQVVEGGIKRGRFARTGRTGDQDHPTARRQQATEVALHLRIKAEGIHLLQAHILTEDAHHDHLAMDTPQSGDPKLDRPPVHLQGAPAVLRPARFRDIQTGHDLDAGDDTQEQVARQPGYHTHPSVDSTTDADPIRVWLDVEIARAAAHGIGDQGVDYPDGRDLLAGGYQLFDRDPGFILRRHFLKVDGTAWRLLQHAITVVPPELLAELRLRCQGKNGVQAGGVPQSVIDPNVIRVERRHQEPVSLPSDREHTVFEGCFLGKQRDTLRTGRIV